jgi:transcriptional regulator with XRE-family HTH domain
VVEQPGAGSVSELLSQKIQKARKGAGLTQAQVAEKLGLSRGAVTLWESKDQKNRSAPSISVLKQFCAIVDVSPEYFLSDSEVNSTASVASSQKSSKQDNLPKLTAHAYGCWSWGPAHYKCACKEIANLRGWGK